MLTMLLRLKELRRPAEPDRSVSQKRPARPVPLGLIACGGHKGRQFATVDLFFRVNIAALVSAKKFDKA